MSASDDAYRAAEEAIAEAKREGAGSLVFDREAFFSLDRLPPEIAELTGLQRLDLDNTQVSDLAPLSVLTGLDTLFLNNTHVSDLTPLETLTSLKSLYLNGTQASDMTPLAALAELKSLQLANTQVSDLTPLGVLTELKSLYLNNTPVSDLAPLAAVTGLQSLSINNTNVSDLMPLTALTGLHTLGVDLTRIGDLALLATLTGLRHLDLNNTQVSDLTPIVALTGLLKLGLADTKVSDLTPLTALTGLQELTLANMQVSDLTHLAALTGLRRLVLNNTQVSDLTPLTALTELTSLGLNNTQVSDLTLLAALTELKSLSLNNTQVSDLTPLATLRWLTSLDLDETQVSDLTPLAKLTGLLSLYLNTTQVSDLTPLRALTELQLLDLSNTQVSDLRPLRKLERLREAYSFAGLSFKNIPACTDPRIAEIASFPDAAERAQALFALLDEGWQPPVKAKEPPPEPDLDELLQGPILSDALADVEKGEERFEATSIDSGPERTPDKRYRQMIETLAYAARRLGGTATENRIGRDLVESFRDYAECLGVDPPNPRMLNYIGQSIGGVMQDDDALASLDGFDKERIGGFLAENENLIRGYFPSARKAAEFDSETDPEILAKELLPKIAGVREITVQANVDGLFADSVITALDVLNRRAEGAIKVYATTDNDKSRESAIKELRRASVLVTAFVGRIKGRLVQWLKAQAAYVRENPYTTFAANVTVLSSYPAAYANTITLATSVVAKITPFFEALWQLVGKIPLPF